MDCRRELENMQDCSSIPARRTGEGRLVRRSSVIMKHVHFGHLSCGVFRIYENTVSKSEF